MALAATVVVGALAAVLAPPAIHAYRARLGLIVGFLQLAHALLIDQILQRHRIQVIDHLAIERGPEFMRHALARLAVVAARTVPLAATAGGVQRLVHGEDDVGHGHVARQAGERVTAAGAAHAVHEFVATQFPEQLFQVGKRNILTLADGRKSDRTAMLPHSQIDHGSHGETPFGS